MSSAVPPRRRARWWHMFEKREQTCMATGEVWNAKPTAKMKNTSGFGKRVTHGEMFVCVCPGERSVVECAPHLLLGRTGPRLTCDPGKQNTPGLSWRVLLPHSDSSCRSVVVCNFTWSENAKGKKTWPLIDHPCSCEEGIMQINK